MPLSAQKPKFKKDVEQVLHDAWIKTYGSNDPGKYGKKMADDFAKTAADGLVDAIEKYVKAAAIQITPSTLVAPPSGGPVTGVILPADVNIS